VPVACAHTATAAPLVAFVHVAEKFDATP